MGELFLMTLGNCSENTLLRTLSFETPVPAPEPFTEEPVTELDPDAGEVVDIPSSVEKSRLTSASEDSIKSSVMLSFSGSLFFSSQPSVLYSTSAA